ncbi:Hypp3547 [Branchiostoma lanceolatum]|uniref:Hypp3547 protein n=1 Tax=Branchiostoma lanceolatum TaxID=7740 RepID=A0A8J9ZZZ9_BRALA|nr:Hypp3547 [Branchiostoma lanceolatum]
MLKGLLDKLCLLKKVKITTADKQWMTVRIKELLAERQQAFCSRDTTVCSRLRNAVAKHIKKAKRLYYEREVANLKHSNPGHWFKSIKALMGMDSVKEDASNPSINWKEAVVRAVPKKPRPHFPSEYRQISLVSCVGKVYEGLLRDALLQDTASSFAPSQHGFVARRSTVTALIYILQSWHEALNSNPKMDVHAVFVDFSRAFDTISHSQLLTSLADMGIRWTLWLSISCYLEGRTQKVRWGSCVSKSHDVPAGVPQGGLLLLTLFVICINSLDARLPRSIAPVKYADDRTTSEMLMASLPGQTQQALDSIVDWGETFSLGVNGKKTMDMIISARKEDSIPVPPHPTIAGHVIQRATTFKLLGVHITANLTWDVHVDFMLRKSRPRVYYLAAAKKARLPVDVLIQIFLTFVRRLLEYGSPV